MGISTKKLKNEVDLKVSIKCTFESKDMLDQRFTFIFNVAKKSLEHFNNTRGATEI